MRVHAAVLLGAPPVSGVHIQSTRTQYSQYTNSLRRIVGHIPDDMQFGIHILHAVNRTQNTIEQLVKCNAMYPCGQGVRFSFWLERLSLKFRAP